MSIVCTTSLLILNESLNLASLRKHEFINVKRRPDRRVRKVGCFHHVILRNPNTRHVYLLYENGKCVILGPRSEREIAAASTWISLVLCCKVLKPPVLRNVVYVYTWNIKECSGPDALGTLHARLKKRYKQLQLDPELSPALMFNPTSCPHAKVMIFRTGRVNVTGLKSFADILLVRSELDAVL